MRGIRGGGRVLAIARQVMFVLAVAVALSAIGFPSSASATAPCTTTPASGGQWPMYGHDVANTRVQPEDSALTPSAVAGLAPEWAFSTSSVGDETGFNSTPVVYGGCVYVASFGGTAYALEAPKPGSGGVVVGAAAISGKTVIYLVDEFTAPYAIALNRSTGAVVWKSAPFAPPLTSSALQEGSYTNSSPIIANGYILAGWSP